jgi:hypothetical protein
MSWRRWLAARQLLAEEFVGTHVRAARDAEDAQFRRSLEAVKR